MIAPGTCDVEDEGTPPGNCQLYELIVPKQSATLAVGLANPVEHIGGREAMLTIGGV